MKGPTRGGAARTTTPWIVAAAVAGGLLLAPGAGAAAQETAGRQAPAAPCPTKQLIANSAERTGHNQMRITVINDGPKACVLKGFPTVALAGQGSPDRNKPLNVARQGQARAVQLPVGGRATTQLTFTPVLGEADGYCASGAEPTVAPSIVLGVGGGGLQLSPADGGEFALCGTTVRATAFRGSGS
ncbi:DUF4232 domain-containing protein [Streptomyces xanthophaeus]|uniref:DUF4232 domain-containing protein n=1 Tax=Streptomyces xanthophaeus TaxID=67385 RepID=UPI00386D2ABE|nr:DUF4232 domain-containing protein [Streptomyces xanthophaeus]WST58458.1 DUF4232 domain-containing protein [Streptomyces xanthophaeus]